MPKCACLCVFWVGGWGGVTIRYLSIRVSKFNFNITVVKLRYHNKVEKDRNCSHLLRSTDYCQSAHNPK